VTKRVNDFESWARAVERRIDRLERLPRRGGGGSGVGGGAVSGPAVGAGWIGNVNFSGGLARQTFTPMDPAPRMVLVTLNPDSGESASVASSCTSNLLTMRAPVANGVYQVSVMFFFWA